MSKNKDWKKEERRIKALARQEEYDKLNLKERVEKLDRQNGEGTGTKKQRAKIATQMENRIPFQRRKKASREACDLSSINLKQYLV